MNNNQQSQKKSTEIIDMAISVLSPREERVIKMRFGLANFSEHSTEEIARNLHLSKSRVDEIKTRALRKLRNPLRLISSNRSLADIQRAVSTFERILETGNADDVASTIREELPELSLLADVVPKSHVKLYQFVQDIILLLTLAFVIMNKSQANSVTVQQVNSIVINQNAPIQPKNVEQIKNHAAFLNGYAKEDEGLYDDYPSR